MSEDSAPYPPDAMRIHHFVKLHYLAQVLVCVGILLVTVASAVPSLQWMFYGGAAALVCGLLLRLFVSVGVRMNTTEGFQCPNSADGLPVEPSGSWVDVDTSLEVGQRVLALWQDRWWRAVVTGVSGRRVMVTYLGWNPIWDQPLTRDRLQLEVGSYGASLHPASSQRGNPMTEPFSKPCPYCGQSVPADARRCPQCRSWITGKRWWLSWQGASTFLYLALLAFMLFFVLRQLHRSSESFETHRTQVNITESKMHYTEDRPGTTVTIIGRIMNDSPVKWNSPYFEVQCFDAAGKLVDSFSSHDYGMVFLPKTEHTFRLSFSAHRAPSEYAKFKVFVRDASDGNRWP